MSEHTRKISGWILITMPTIIYGGYFLLSILSGQQDHLNLTDFQKSMFRAGHAHAGVLVMLALIVQLFVDNMSFSENWKWFVRITIPVSSILVSMGFFASATGEGLTAPNGLIFILYAGMIVLASGLFAAGIGMIRKKQK